MEIKLLAHTQLSDEFKESLNDQLQEDIYYNKISDGQAVALSAIRTCYSSNVPSEILEQEGNKYFNNKATDGKGGNEADRLIRHIMQSKHSSTMEHINFTFSIEGVSRALLCQLTRHRHFSFSVQSQRYVKFGSEDKSGGFDYITPDSIKNKGLVEEYDTTMKYIQITYNYLRNKGVPAEDCRAVLPNAATCNLVLTGNLRTILEFYFKRNPSTHAQIEIAQLAEKIKEKVVSVEPWTASFFKNN